MQHIADDDDALSAEITESGAEREGVEQSLRGVCVPAVAGVDHRGAGALGDEVGRP